jgi:hypothetical protein
MEMEESHSKKNRGFQVFMRCLDEGPDVLGAIRQAGQRDSARSEVSPEKRHRKQPRSFETSIQSLKEPIKSLSGHVANLGDRFFSRPTSAPDPWTYFTMVQPREIKASKFSSRREPSPANVPGSGSYFLAQKASTRFGFMPREPKNKASLNDGKLGPGFYEINESASKYSGVVFPKDSRDLVISRGKGVPGPGHYRNQSCDSIKSYSMPKSSPSPMQPIQKLGPGCYETEHVQQPKGPTFGNSLRFEMPYFERIESED